MAATAVQKELGKILSDFRRYKVVRELAAAWAVLALIGGAFLLLYKMNGTIVPFAVPGILVAGVLIAVVVLIRGNRLALTLREIARQVESDNPQLNSLLLAAAEQEPDKETGQLNFLQMRVIREALEANRRSPWGQRFIQRLFWAQSLHLVTLCGFAVVLMSLAFIAPQQLRLGADTEAGLEIAPGDVTVEKGSSLAVVAKFKGQTPGAVQLVYKPENGPEQRVSMARSLSDPLFGFTLPELQEKTAYRIEYDGQRSRDFTAKVFEFPELKRADADLKYPVYTGMAPQKLEDTRRLTAVEGTDVRYSFYFNKPVKSARLRGTNDVAITLTNAAANPVNYTSDFQLAESGTYKLELVDEDGRTNKVMPEFVFVALANQKPKLKFQAPRGDQRVSSLQEVRFDATTEDDFGLADYGLAYTMAGGQTEFLSLGSSSNAVRGMISKPNEAKNFSWLLAMEKLATEPGQLVSYYLWADDLGPDGKVRRSESDMFFAEVRPFEEIFRQGNSPSSQQQQQQQQQQGGGQAGELLEMQKEIITATWNLRRRENPAKPTPAYKKDAGVVHESQGEAIEKARAMAEEMQDDKMLALVTTAATAMESAEKTLKEAVDKNALEPLPKALEYEQQAYQALLKLQAREYQVTRSQSQSASSRSRQQRAQQQLDQLELKDEENRYEQESEAEPMMNEEQREALQVLNRLKELARRQQDMSERIKELQSALSEAKTQEEKEKLERMLKRLQEEQQQIVQDTDELRQRMAQPENQSRMAEARQQLDQTRQQSRETSEQLEQRNLGQALSSSSRAQQELQKLSDDFRKATSNQFAEEMRQMRQQARDLEKKHNELAEKLSEAPQPTRRALSEEGPAKEALEKLAQEQSALTNLLTNMRQVTEQSEAAEPLLSRQLYETLRKTSQQTPEKILSDARRVLERGYMPETREIHNRAEQTVRELKEGVERAAESVLGNEADSLRFAANELRNLTERVERELERGRTASGAGGTNGVGSELGTNTLSRMLAMGSTNQPGARQAGGRQRGEQQQDGNQGQRGERGEQQQGGQGQEGQQSQQGQRGEQSGQQGQRGEQGQQNQQTQDGQQGERGQQSQNQEGQQGQQGENGQQGQQGQQQQRQQGQEGQQGQQGQQQGEGQGQGQGRGNQQGQLAQNQPQGQQEASENQEGQQQGQQPGQGRGQAQQAGNRDGQPQNPQNRDNQPRVLTNAGGNREGGRTAPGGGFEGPMTGRDFVRWTDRLRDVEEVLQAPDLRLDVSRIREQARLWRAEQKRHAEEPQWNLLEEQVINPLRIVQKRVADELARHNSRDAVVPVDRDPVPQKYSDLVSRYYERLGAE